MIYVRKSSVCYTLTIKLPKEEHLDPGKKIVSKQVSFDEFVTYVTTPSFMEVQFANEMLRMKLELMNLEVCKKKLF